MRDRHIPILLALVALVSATPGYAQNRDGGWWRTTPESFRLGYIAGYVAGREQQMDRWHALVADLVPSLPATEQERVTAVLRMATDGKLPKGLTFDAFLERVDAIYAIPENRVIHVHQAFTLARKAVLGEDTEYLACEAEYFRLAHVRGLSADERLQQLGEKAAACARLELKVHGAEEAYELQPGGPSPHAPAGSPPPSSGP